MESRDELCKNGHCVPEGSGDGQQCERSEECSSNGSCKNGQCVNTCNDDKDCPNGSKCNEGTCGPQGIVF